VDAGYQPELAYFETMHELKLIVDLMYQGGLQYMRYSISDTAEYGDYVSGPRIVDQRTREEMKRILAEIQDGTFAKRWIEEGRQGAPEFRRMRGENARSRIEEVGAELRSHMAFINPRSAPDGWTDDGRAGSTPEAAAAGTRDDSR
jgi:ketol-acid reductoisomerase